MDTTINQQVAMDEALVPYARRLRIGRSNFRLLSDISFKESTLQLVYDVLHINPFFKAFLVTADVLEIYMRQFWTTATVHHHYICHHQQVSNRKSLGYDSLRLSQARILWGLYHKRNVDFAYLMWEDFVYQVEHKHTKKSNEMYYPRFTKPKASVWKTRSSSDIIVTPPTAAAGPRLSTSAKGKQPAITFKAKNEGTGTISGVPDVPTDDSEEEISWNSLDEEGDDNDDDKGDDDGDGEEMNLYKALVEVYESNKIILDTYGDTVMLKRRRDDDADKDEEPSPESDRGSKRHREGKEPESASALREKATRSAGKSTQGCVEDLQLGVKSYQKKLNLTRLDTYRSDLKHKEAYIANSNPRGFIYKNKDNQNRLMQIDELHKFSDGTLTDVRTALDDRLKGIRMKYLPQTIWRKNKKDRAAAMIQAIDKMLKTRKIMRSLERNTKLLPGIEDSHHVPSDAMHNPSQPVKVKGNLKMEVKVPGSSCLIDS
nr:hypothetical protein [Tanacetum cinerariifolium]